MPPSSSADAIFHECILDIIAPEAASLAQQAADLILVFAFVARLVAVVHVAHLALAVHDHGARHARNLIEGTDLALRVEQYRKRDRGRLEETERVSGFWFDIHAQQRESSGLVPAVELIEYRHFLAAGAAPAGPEIDQHHPAFEIRQVDGVAEGCRQLERGGRRTGGDPRRS